jgi:hypothetical protein
LGTERFYSTMLEYALNVPETDGKAHVGARSGDEV